MKATQPIQRILAWGMMTFNLTLLVILFRDWNAYEMKIIQAPFIPVTLISLFTWLIPALLILAITSLCIRKHQTLGWATNLLIHLLMSLYFLLLITGTTGVPCACGGLLQNMSISQHFYLHLSLSCLSLILIPMRRVQKEPRPLTAFRQAEAGIK